MAPMGTNRPKSKEALIEEFRIETIQEAAMRVIARKGVSGASMQEIAEEAGIAKGTIYLYFESQRDLLDRTVDFVFSRLEEQLEEAMAGEGSFTARLERLLRSRIEFLRMNVVLLQLCGATKLTEGADGKQAGCDRSQSPHYREYTARFERFLAAAVEAGEIRPIPAHRLGLFIQEGFMALLVARLQQASAPSVDEEMEWLMEFLLHGISTKRSRS